MDALVVGLARRVVRLRDEQRSRLAEGVDAADVVDVALGQQDVADRPVVDRVVQPRWWPDSKPIPVLITTRPSGVTMR